MYSPSIYSGDPDVLYASVYNSEASAALPDGQPCCAYASASTSIVDAPANATKVALPTVVSTNPNRFAGIVGPNPSQGNRIPAGSHGLIQVWGFRRDVKKDTATDWDPATQIAVLATAAQDEVGVETFAVAAGDRLYGDIVGTILNDPVAADPTAMVWIRGPLGL